MVSRGCTAVAAFALAAGPVLLTAGPAGAGDRVFVEVQPSTAEAGSLVGVRGNCPDNSVPATVNSGAFGRVTEEVTVRPQYGYLTAAVTVPPQTFPGKYIVRLTCPGGRFTTTNLYVVAKNRPAVGPATGLGGTAGDGPAMLIITGGLVAVAAGVWMGLLTLRRRGARA